MKAADMIATLEALPLRLFVEKGRLRWEGPLPVRLVPEMREHRAALMRWVTANRCVQCGTKQIIMIQMDGDTDAPWFLCSPCWRGAGDRP